jgi:predicted metal-dependent hydrolase
MTSDRKRAFRQRVGDWADRLDVGAHAVTLRPMRRKWASCSTTGRLTFSNDVLALDEDLQDYVIVHELLHFSVPNHGRLWKSLMSAWLGDYAHREARLRERAAMREKSR